MRPVLSIRYSFEMLHPSFICLTISIFSGLLMYLQVNVGQAIYGRFICLLGLFGGFCYLYQRVYLTRPFPSMISNCINGISRINYVRAMITRFIRGCLVQ